jgi:FkbM family methyltransferase
MSDQNQIETTFQALLGRAPLPHEVDAYKSLKSSPKELGLQLMASQEFRRRAMLGTFPAGSSQWVCGEIRDGLRLWVDLMDAGVSAGAIADNWEPAETNFVLSILTNGSTFLDIGAHLGWFTVLGAHRVGPEGRVYAFEPRRTIFEHMRASVEANGFQKRCVLRCAALSDKVGTTSMATFSAEFNSGHAVMVTGAPLEGASLVTDIPTVVLDELEWDRRIDLIKIDVEGAEAMVLRGGRKLLARDRPVIVSELFPRWLRTVSGVSPDDYMDTLKEFGYRVFELTSGGIGCEIHSLSKPHSISEDYFTNIVALTEEHMERYLVRPLDGRVEAYEAALARLQADLAAEKAAHTQQTDMRARSDETLLAFRQEADDRIRLQTEAYEAALARLRTELAAKTAERSDTTVVTLQHETDDRITQLSQENKTLATQIAALNERKAVLSAQLASLHASNIWRACTVLTRLAQPIPPPVRKQLVRSAKLGWWTMKGELPERWKAWRQMRHIGLPVTTSQPPLPPHTDDPASELARWANRRGPVALIVDDRWPEPDRDSGSVDAVNLVRNLVALGFEVAYAVASDLIQDARYREDLTALNATPLPQNGAAYVQKYIEDNRDIFSLVILTRVGCGGALFELVRYNCPDAKIVFNTVDLHFLREQRTAQLSGNQNEIQRANQTRDREEWLVGHADLTIVVSETEREILAACVPRAPVLHLPLSRDIVPPTASFSARKGIGFVGGFAHQPNLDAIRWFLAEIWPLVRQRCPDLTFSIAGSKLPAGIVRPGDGVTYVGSIDDLHAWFETLLMSVAPLRIGAGAKGKVVSSLSNGLPCVLSAIAAEGMNLIDGENVLIADTPEAFADKIIALVTDEALWRKLSAGALELARQHFSHQANLRDLHEALVRMGVQVARESPTAGK